MRWSKLQYTPILLLTMLAISPSTLAQDSQKYQVELIVYSHIDQNELQAEHWPTVNTQLFPSANTVTLAINPQGKASINNDSLTPAGFQLLNRSAFQLKPVAHTLKRNANNHILAHLAWQQDFARMPKLQLQLISSATTSPAAQYTQLDGLFNISLNRYFNTNYHFIFSLPQNTLQKMDPNYSFHNVIDDEAYFELNQSRRMRSNELNYIDHPLYGIIVMITAVKPKTA